MAASTERKIAVCGRDGIYIGSGYLGAGLTVSIGWNIEERTQYHLGDPYFERPRQKTTDCLPAQHGRHAETRCRVRASPSYVVTNLLALACSASSDRAGRHSVLNGSCVAVWRLRADFGIHFYSADDVGQREPRDLARLVTPHVTPLAVDDSRNVCHFPTRRDRE